MNEIELQPTYDPSWGPGLYDPSNGSVTYGIPNSLYTHFTADRQMYWRNPEDATWQGPSVIGAQTVDGRSIKQGGWPLPQQLRLSRAVRPSSVWVALVCLIIAMVGGAQGYTVVAIAGVVLAFWFLFLGYMHEHHNRAHHLIVGTMLSIGAAGAASHYAHKWVDGQK